MRLTCDLHIHSRYSFDSDESLAEICRRAVKRNVGVIAITDHCDMIQGRDGIAYYLAVEEQRMEAFAKAREEYQQLEILYGIEIEMPWTVRQRQGSFWSQENLIS